MRIAGGIIGIFLAVIILVQALAAGTANALAEKGGDSGGTFGFFVAVLVVIGSALLIGKVMKGAFWVFAAAGGLAWIGAASSIFSDLWVWGFVAFAYAAATYWGMRKARLTAGIPVSQS